MPESEKNKELIKQAKEKAAFLIYKLKEHSITMSLAESCTAGLVSSLLADIPGASEVFWGSFVCYTKEAKIIMLGLNSRELDEYDLVSNETACLMAKAAMEKSGVNVSAAVTGLAGPGTDGSAIPVGTVWIAVTLNNGNTGVKKFFFSGSRDEVRISAAIAVIEELLNALSGA